MTAFIVPDDWKCGKSMIIGSLIVAVIGALAYMLWKSTDILLIIFGGVIFGLILEWCANGIRYYTKIPYSLSLLCVVLLLLGGCVLSVFLFAPAVREQFQTVTEQIPQVLAQVQNWVRSNSITKSLWGELNTQDDWVEYISQNTSSLMKDVTNIFTFTFSTLVAFIVIFIAGVYIAYEPDFYRTGLIKLVPIPYRSRAHEILDRIHFTLQWWIIGQIISVLFIGIATALGLWLIGIPLAVLLGLFSALMTFIPFVGPALSALPPLLIAVTMSMSKVFWVIVLYVIIQNMQDYLITIPIHRRNLKLPPILIIFFQFFLASAIGFLGVLLAIPLVAVIVVLVQMIYIEDILGDRPLIIDDSPKT
ncbi:MAG: AI-2E family transporter [bacterium]|jgi:predicted PurR-regulated permease PerM